MIAAAEDYWRASEGLALIIYSMLTIIGLIDIAFLFCFVHQTLAAVIC
jgi:hypothetical protein